MSSSVFLINKLGAECAPPTSTCVHVEVGVNQHPVNQHAGGLHPSDTAFLYWPVTKLLRLNAISRQLQLRGCALQFVDEPQDNLTCVCVCVCVSVCKFKAHKRCAVRATNNCKWTTLASIGKDIIEDEDGVRHTAQMSCQF